MAETQWLAAAGGGRIVRVMAITMSDILSRREAILEIAARHGAHNVRVFGSCVRGQATDQSDLDLLVEMEESRSLLDRIALMHELEDLLGRKVDVVNQRALHWTLRDQILAEGVAL